MQNVCILIYLIFDQFSCPLFLVNVACQYCILLIHIFLPEKKTFFLSKK